MYKLNFSTVLTIAAAFAFTDPAFAEVLQLKCIASLESSQGRQFPANIVRYFEVDLTRFTGTAFDETLSSRQTLYVIRSASNRAEMYGAPNIWLGTFDANFTSMDDFSAFQEDKIVISREDGSYSDFEMRATPKGDVAYLFSYRGKCSPESFKPKPLKF